MIRTVVVGLTVGLLLFWGIALSDGQADAREGGKGSGAGRYVVPKENRFAPLGGHLITARYDPARDKTVCRDKTSGHRWVLHGHMSARRCFVIAALEGGLL